MSKKKASGNTMTLKDFHGGSIPSDLPLPSAPGVTVRPSDRSGQDRPNSWGNPIGRPENWSRPHTSPATRHFDDKTPFLTDTACIGRNFDEDERKPLDGVSAPRRTISDESIRVPGARVELKPEYGSGGSLVGQQGLAASGAVNAYAAKVSEVTCGGVNSQNLGGNSGLGVGGGYPNAWAARKEVVRVNEPVQQSAWSGTTAVSKLASASALEKVSSGRWKSKLSLNFQADVEDVMSPKMESVFQSNSYGNSSYNMVDVMGGRDYHDATLVRQVERGLNIEDGVLVTRKEFPEYEIAVAPIYSDVKEWNPTIHMDRTPVARNDGRLGGSELQPPVHLEPSERPKLKLLPRTKPLKSSEQPAIDHVQGHRRASDTGHAEAFEVSGNVNPAKLSMAITESVLQAMERPKLNIKSQSQHLEQLEGNIEKDRNALFGGARPRELVLKERGIGDVTINNHDLVQQFDRVEHNVPKIERDMKGKDWKANPSPADYGEKTENPLLGQRIGKRHERKDHRQEIERVDMQRTWRNESRRNNRETERKQQQVERPPSPETWRKPVEQPKPDSPDSGGPRHGKVASAVELAQAFSRSVSDPKAADRFSGQRSLPGRNQMPFSRLMGPTPRPQINGY
ncbi:uncharacterized protein LOC121268677 isoform X3 [Juglans microcarpa x Juglans regia]|uniref:uncharacterized protein LOC121268677 isoform X3 n=1 Tax=Juglans microcarpa x Juglans regia TaxID=2249226 RepID=UPI001B7EBB9D|nr:uncharacterized protein LOC121268677 isoform X3 [Juglans microcarpa x Juglans regia]